MVEEQGYEGDPVKAICDLWTEKGPEFSVQLHRLLGKDTLRAASFHHLHVPPTQNLVTINA